MVLDICVRAAAAIADQGGGFCGVPRRASPAESPGVLSKVTAGYVPVPAEGARTNTSAAMATGPSGDTRRAQLVYFADTGGGPLENFASAARAKQPLFPGG